LWSRSGRVVVPVLLLFLSSCGYHLSGLSDGPIPLHGKIAIPFFVNATEEPIIEEEITPVVRREFIRDGRLEVTDGPAAGYVLEGRIESYQEVPLSFDRQQNVLEYRVVLTVTVRLMKREATAVLWDEKITATAEYPVTSDVMATRLAKRRAVEEAARNLAEDAVDHMLEGF
jgi:outer membrane lipopolysaccharide assembly protein LptE/RlpB